MPSRVLLQLPLIWPLLVFRKPVHRQFSTETVSKTPNHRLDCWFILVIETIRKQAKHIPQGLLFQDDTQTYD